MSEVITGFFSTFQPEPELKVSEWSDLHRMLPQIAAAEPGRWRTSRTPYLKSIMDDLSPSSPIEEVIFMKGAQIGASESGNNWVGYVMDYAPGPMLVVQPTVDIAKRYSQQRIAPMVRECQRLLDKVGDPRSRDSSNTQMSKEFPGGVLLLAGANSAAGLRSMPIRYLMLDETDAYPPDCDGEGSPIDLAVARTRTFSRRKIYKVSTPTIKGHSHIEAEYSRTDQRRYYLPCPHCGHMDYLRWDRINIPKDESERILHEKTCMTCTDCGGMIEEHHKTDMLSRGEWRATNPDNADRKKRGYHLSSLYSPVGWYSWADAAKQWTDAQSSPEKLKTFINTVLGETWEEEYSNKLNADGLAQRAELYDLLTVPAGGLVITAGVDVQDNRIEIIQRAWGVGEESWLVNRAVVYGDPGQSELWNQVLDVLSTDFRHSSGALMKTEAALIDSGGHFTHEVYAFTRQHRDKHFLAIQGRSGPKPLLGKPTKQDINARNQVIKRGAILYPVGVDTAKSTIYGRLKRNEHGAGAYHWPMGLDNEYWSQLTAEKQKTKVVNGYTKRVWTKAAGDRNEALDCEVYAYAGLEYVYTRHNRNTFWQQMFDKIWKNTPKGVESEKSANVAGGRIKLSNLKRG